jgi:branched-subunit amino acid transport protein
MNATLHDWTPWLALIGASVGTYFCRAIGVLLSDQINQESEIFRWLSAVTYAMVAALTVRMVLLPVGVLSHVPTVVRIGVCAMSLVVMMSRPQRRMVPALLTGSLLIMTYGWLA